MESFKEALLGFDIGRRCDGVELPAPADQTGDIDKEILVGKTVGCAGMLHGVTAASTIP
jgi:hypothetical protein